MKEGRKAMVGCLGRSKRPAPFADGREWFHKGLIEIVDLGKVLPAVILGFAKDVIFDKIENDIPKVAAAADPPAVEHGLGQRPILIEGKGADPVQKFRPGHMLGLFRTLGLLFLQLLDGAIQGLANESVGLAVKTAVLLTD